jgi:hypothetical protein
MVLELPGVLVVKRGQVRGIWALVQVHPLPAG